MPPLTSEKYIAPSPAGLELRRRVKDSKLNTYRKMQGIISRYGEQTNGVILSTVTGVTHLESPKAIYRAEGQPKGELTRAWLNTIQGSFSPTYNERISLRTDRVVVDDDEVFPIAGSEFVHLSLDKEGKMRTEHYRHIGGEQLVELMEDAVGDTLALIGRGAVAAAAAEA